MIRAVVALSLVAVVLGSHCCTHKDQEKVKDAWNDLWNSPDSSVIKIIFGREVFQALFERDPASKALFSRVNVDDINSPEFASHMVRVLTGLDLTINLLDDTASLDAELHHLAVQHQAREGVTSEHFRVFGEVLEDALTQVLNQYDIVAWRNCFRRIGKGITEGLP